MPELAKPLLSPGVSLKEQRSSKSLGVPLVQIRNVFPLAGFSAVVWPVMAPSLTDHSLGLPSQPVRSLPLKILRKPCSAAGTNTGWANRTAPMRALNILLFIIFFYSRTIRQIGRAHV